MRIHQSFSMRVILPLLHVFSKLYDVHDCHYVLNLQSRVFGCILDMKLIFNC